MPFSYIGLILCRHFGKCVGGKASAKLAAFHGRQACMSPGTWIMYRHIVRVTGRNVSGRKRWLWNIRARRQPIREIDIGKWKQFNTWLYRPTGVITVILICSWTTECNFQRACLRETALRVDWRHVAGLRGLYLLVHVWQPVRGTHSFVLCCNGNVKLYRVGLRIAKCFN